MPGGRPPKPVERKRLTGNPGKRALPAKPEVVVLGHAPGELAPDHLGVHGTRAWNEIVAATTGWLASGETVTVRLYAEAADRRAELIARLQNDGDVLYTDKGYAYAHPAVGMLATLEKQMTSWLSLLGLTPADRTKLGLAEVQRVSKLDELKARRQTG